MGRRGKIATERNPSEILRDLSLPNFTFSAMILKKALKFLLSFVSRSLVSKANSNLVFFLK
ncbi:hypothetical protein [Leptospira interrogans]|uniref:hypothetical protein n=1 Tax=Leptospira interrogans TaxID=173 RepID=UPI0002BD562D|nr:hypothetical protein [Leptospira interrogans]EMJ55092.1 hypothetical protein LEP1GSC013_3404 [Leptospira interrogans serovar Valbuzzi str. Duyster]ENO70100.1 hypothetical protein LEP1GSC012_1885 [Leptospira interrogans serovar Valbuzzi str. Valbuzzi]